MPPEAARTANLSGGIAPATMIRPSRTVDLIALSGTGLMLFALALRSSLRDSVGTLAPLFYATPPPVVGLVAFGLAALLLWNRRRIAAAAW